MVRVFWCSLIASVTALKTWMPDTNMDDGRNWKNAELPRDCDRISIPLDGGLLLRWTKKDSIVAGLALPTTGSLIFDDSISIAFGDKRKCPKPRDAEFARKDWKNWLDPSNWMTNSTKSWLPHSERIPCFGEDVAFPAGKSFAVELPSVLVPVGKIFFDGESYDGDEWAEFLDGDRGRSMFRSLDNSAALPWSHDVPCYGNRKCACGKSAYVFKNRGYEDVPATELHRVVCSMAGRSCETPRCTSPVVPEGHCCGICGAAIKVRDDSGDDELLDEIERKIKDLTRSDGYENMKFYVGRTDDENIEIVIPAEASDYGNVFAFAASAKDVIVESYSEAIISANFSGLTLSSYFLKAGSGIVFGTLFAVLFFFILIYYVFVVLKEQTDLLQISGESPFAFARFRNVLHEADSDEKLEISGGGGGGGGENGDGERDVRKRTFSASSECEEGESRERGEELPESDSQEYTNPTYREMERTRELSLFEVQPERSQHLNAERFKEVEL